MNVKLISAGAGVFGLGALVGWALTADHFERKMHERLDISDARIDHLRETVVALTNFIEEYGDETAPEEVLGEVSETDEASEGPVPTDEEIEETRSGLQALIDTYTTGESSAPDLAQFVDRVVSSEVDRTPPFVISMQQYSWDADEGDEYDKITLKYYPRHRMLLDDEEEPVEDVANTIGWRNLNQFGGDSGDPDTVFIRNRRMRTDFEVVRDDESELPLHIKYGMGKEEFRATKAAGVLKLRPEDRD